MSLVFTYVGGYQIVNIVNQPRFSFLWRPTFTFLGLCFNCFPEKLFYDPSNLWPAYLSGTHGPHTLDSDLADSRGA